MERWPGGRDDVRVVRLSRYPVKSMTGETVDRLELGARGAAGDRAWTVRTEAGKIGSGKTSRRLAKLPGLLDVRAQEHGGKVVVTFPDGGTFAAGDPALARRLSEHLGVTVTLQRESGVEQFDDGPLSLAGSASVDAVAAERGEPVHPERFRANIVLETTTPFVEEQWVGRRIRVGSAVVEVGKALPRCVMVDARTADLPAQAGVLTAVGRANRARLGVVGNVVVPGVVSVGDAVAVLHA